MATKLYRDIKLSLELTNLTKEEYKEIIDNLNMISTCGLETYTYDDEYFDSNFSDKHKQLIKDFDNINRGCYDRR